MNRFALLASSLLLALATYGCAGDCNFAGDCASNEVCHLKTCVASTSQSSLCKSDQQCNEGLPQDLFRCSAGRCERLSNVIIVTDTGTGTVADAGRFDSGNPPFDSGNPPFDSGNPPVDMGNPPVDMGGPDTGPDMGADTGTITDGGPDSGSVD